MKKSAALRLICLILGLSLAFASFPAQAKSKKAQEAFSAFTASGGITELNYSEPSLMLKDMQLVCIKGDFEFYFDPNSLFFGIKSISTGKIFTSNPYNAAASSLYNGNTAKALNSQLILNYTPITNQKNSSMWSYDDCVALSQFEVFRSENGVKVIYSMGKEAGSSILPEIIGKAAFESITQNLSGFAATQIKFLYTEYPADKELPEGFESIKRSDSVFILNQNLTDTEKTRLEGYIKDSGFSAKDLEKEYSALGFSGGASKAPNFKVTVIYTLTEKGLTVTVPADEIEFDTESYYLLDIQLLKYFGSESNDGSGFVFLPDGSGAVTEFSEKQNSVSQIRNELYGTDYGITLPETPSETKPWYLPVFGISNGDLGLLGIIDDGSGLATLSYDIAGGLGSFYTASPILTYAKSETVTTEAKVYSAYSTSNTVKFDENRYTGDYKINYFPLTGDSVSYYDMALICREHYFPEGAESVQSTLPLGIETLGAVNYPSTFLGFSYTATAAVTTFEQNIDMIEKLKNSGVEELSVSLSGWRKDGLDSSALTAFDPESKLGGKKDIKKLFEYGSSNGIPISADISFAFAVTDRLFDGFSATSDTVRLLTSKLGGKMAVRPDLGQYDRESFAYAVTPAKYSKFLDKFAAKAEKSEVSSLLVSDIGESLNSDFRKKKAINREQTLDLVTSALSKQKDTELSFRGANAYILEYASSISDLPTDSSSLSGTDYSVPFVQLVCHGIIPCYGTELNSESDLKTALLKCISAVSSPKFVLGSDNMDKIKLSSHTQYNSVSFANRLDDCIEAYEYINGAFAQVCGETLIGHYTLAEGITKLDFSNGISVYVNITDSDYTSGNITVPAMDYKTVKEG